MLRKTDRAARVTLFHEFACPDGSHFRLVARPPPPALLAASGPAK